MNLLLFIALLLPFILYSPFLQAQESQAPEIIKIAFLAEESDAPQFHKLQPTKRFLEQEHSNWQIQFLPMNTQALRQAVIDESVDYLITSPANYVMLEKAFGIIRIATLQNAFSGRRCRRYGAVLFTRANHPDIFYIDDLKNQHFLATNRDSFGGFQMAWRTLMEHDINPDSDFSLLEFNHREQASVVKAVLMGEADAGTVRTDTLERLVRQKQLDLAQLRILNRQSYDERFRHIHSTRLYPEWPLARLHNTDHQQAEILLLSLLNVDEAFDSEVSWTIPMDYTPVHQLMQSLKIGPYQPRAPLTLNDMLQQVVHEYRALLLIASTALFGLMLFSMYVTRVNKRLAAQEKQLRHEVDERRKVQEALASHRDLLEEKVQERTESLKNLNTALEIDIQARREAEEKLRLSERTLRQLHDITSRVDAQFSERLGELLHTGCEHFQLETGMLVAVDDFDYRLIQMSHIGQRHFSNELQFDHEFCQRMLQRCKPLAITDVSNSRWSKYKGFGDNGFESFLGACVYSEGKNYGVLAFVSRHNRAHTFTSVDLDLVQLIADWLGREIDRENAQARSKQHLFELSHLMRVQTLGELTSGLAHELNQPLTAISNYLRGGIRRIKAGEFDSPLIPQALELASDEAERAGKIIRQLRALVKKDISRREKLTVANLLKDSTTLIQGEINRHQIQVFFHIAPDLPPIYADRIQLEQVFLNLIRNAVDALENHRGKREIHLLASRLKPQTLTLSVIDSGPGIAPDIMERLFHPFISGKTDGMGMGLSISQSIIEAHQGKIWASSSQYGAGLHCQLPINQENH